MSNHVEYDNSIIFYTIDLCLLIAMYIFIFIMIMLIISVYVFGILFLIKDKYHSDICKSNIWMYVVTALFVSLYGNIMMLRNYEYISRLSYIYIFLGIWGIIILISESCGDIMESYLFAYAWGLSLLFMFVGICLCTINCMSRYL